VSELSNFIDDAVVNWLAQKPMPLAELAEVSHANPPHLRATLKRLRRAGKVSRLRKNGQLIYSLTEDERET
jgi:DNA-binding IclR family transcriptional regulator